MNVDDVEDQTVDGDGLVAIFNKQRELMLKYHAIEVRNGTGYADISLMAVTTKKGLDLHDRKVQALLKDFAWRVTEEITEATIAYIEHPKLPQHAQEEVADALHFLIELLILSGIDEGHISENMRVATNEDSSEAWFESVTMGTTKSPSEAGYRVIERIGCAMNCLKQKPWKQTHILTDVDRYRDDLGSAFMLFPIFAASVGITTHDAMLSMYLRKSEVNKFRQRSAY